MYLHHNLKASSMVLVAKASKSLNNNHNNNNRLLQVSALPGDLVVGHKLVDSVAVLRFGLISLSLHDLYLYGN